MPNGKAMIKVSKISKSVVIKEPLIPPPGVVICKSVMITPWSINSTIVFALYRLKAKIKFPSWSFNTTLVID